MPSFHYFCLKWSKIGQILYDRGVHYLVVTLYIIFYIYFQKMTVFLWFPGTGFALVGMYQHSFRQVNHACIQYSFRNPTNCKIWNLFKNAQNVAHIWAFSDKAGWRVYEHIFVVLNFSFLHFNRTHMQTSRSSSRPIKKR